MFTSAPESPAPRRVVAVEDLYNARILALSAALNDECWLSDADGVATVDSPLCGSRITVDLRVRDGRIIAYGHRVYACALGRAAAAIVQTRIIGRTAPDVRTARDMVAAMLAAAGPPPDGDWSELRILQPAHAHKMRHASILLPFDAVLRAWAAIQAKEMLPGNKP